MLVAEGAVEIRVLRRQGQKHPRDRADARGFAQYGATRSARRRAAAIRRVHRDRASSIGTSVPRRTGEGGGAGVDSGDGAAARARALGYPGGISILKDDLATLRPAANRSR